MLTLNDGYSYKFFFVDGNRSCKVTIQAPMPERMPSGQDGMYPLMLL